LLSAIPKAEWLKGFIADPSAGAANRRVGCHIARTHRRVLVVLDDLDRMEAKELETVFSF